MIYLNFHRNSPLSKNPAAKQWLADAAKVLNESDAEQKAREAVTEFFATGSVTIPSR